MTAGVRTVLQTSTMVDLVRARSFGSIAERYDRYRPSTPPAVIDWLLPFAADHVVDLAAGTGATTKGRVRRVRAVTAIEPDPGMREVLVATVPRATVVAGTAEAIPLSDDSVDAVCVSSAWHWFDQPSAANEIARVLRDGGRLGVVGTGLDHDAPLIATVDATLAYESPTPRDSGHDARLPDGTAFGDIETHSLKWTQKMVVEDLVQLFATYSRMIVLTEQRRSELLDRARQVLLRELSSQGGDDLDVPMRSGGWRVHRQPRRR